MSNFPIYERIIWFEGQARGKKYPNASKLAQRFELSPKTAQRAIDFLRDRMGAPLEYDASRKGYFYSDQSFELPHFQTSQEEILAILIAKNLLSYSAGGIISRAINKFSKKLFMETGILGLTESRLDGAFSASWAGYSPASSEIFKKTASALISHRLISFAYFSPGNSKASRRNAEPHHLQHYMGSWILIAWCRLQKDWRKFYLSRMHDVTVAQEYFTPRSPANWKYQIGDAFGIFQTGDFITATLRFTPFRARWIKEQVWHPKQKMVQNPDGSLDLSLPVSDFREIKLKILQFGADVEVLGPLELRDEVKREIERMGELYSSGI